jgi:hypothetical protein
MKCVRIIKKLLISLKENKMLRLLGMAKDIDFKQLSDDRKVLEKNCSNIMSALLGHYGYRKEEIDDINLRYHAQTEYKRIVDWLEQGSAKERVLADLYFATEIDNLERVNHIMNGKVESFTEKDMHLLKILGLSTSGT